MLPVLSVREEIQAKKEQGYQIHRLRLPWYAVNQQ